MANWTPQQDGLATLASLLADIHKTGSNQQQARMI